MMICVDMGMMPLKRDLHHEGCLSLVSTRMFVPLASRRRRAFLRSRDLRTREEERTFFVRNPSFPVSLSCKSLAPHCKNKPCAGLTSVVNGKF